MNAKVEQLAINFNPDIRDVFPTIQDYMQHCVHTCGVPMKVQAADMDYSPSHWSRKIAASDNDSMRLTALDIQKWMDIHKDYRPAEYFVSVTLGQTQTSELERLRQKVAELEGRG